MSEKTTKQTRKAVAKLALATNTELLNASGIQAKYPQLSNWSPEALANTNEGYEALKQAGALDELYNVNMKFYLAFIHDLGVKNPWENADFGETYNIPFGEWAQTLYTDLQLPVNPQYDNDDLQKDFAEINPFINRNNKLYQNFWKLDKNFQNIVNIKDGYTRKTIISEYGMAEDIVSKFLANLEKSYKIQTYIWQKEAMNAAINGTAYPLQATQTITWTTASETPTVDEYRELLEIVADLADNMEFGPTTNAYNAAKHYDLQDRSRLRLLIRPEIKNAIRFNVLPYAYNPTELNLDIKEVPFKDFGGLKYYNDADHTEQLYPVYNDARWGVAIGFNTTQGLYGSDNVQVALDAAPYIEDPNADVVAVLADKGIVKTWQQNEFRVVPTPFNGMTLSTTYWASAPHNGIGIDPVCNMVVIKHAVSSDTQV